MQELLKDTFNVIWSEAGLVALLLFVSNVVWFWVYLTERTDRRAAWKNNNEFKQEVINAMKEIIPLLAVIKDRSERG